MRRLLLILMIALLPLRAWAGDVMAIQMAAGGFAPVAEAVQVSSATDVSSAGDDMQAALVDCPGHSSMAHNAKPGTESKQPSQSHCSSCVTCQICHSVVVAVSTPGLAAHTPVFQAPVFDAQRFTSVEPALSQKPPIS